MNLRILMFYQDDPKKCTAAKMVRLGLAREVKRIPGSALVLDPYSDKLLLPRDKKPGVALVGIDCSWKKAEAEFARGLGAARRKLPPLLAGNPVNYSKLSMLTTAEALAGALFILGLKDQAHMVLSKFKWGHTFYELNKGLLADYAQMGDESQLDIILRDYGLAGA